MNSAKKVFLFLAAPGLAAALLAAQPVGVEERLRFLETSLVALQQENAALRRKIGEEEKLPAAVLVASAGKESALRIGGLIHGQGEFGSAVDPRYVGVRDRFFLRRARLAVLGRFVEQFDFFMEADFGAGATGERTGISTQITDVFVNWSRHPAANVKFGQFKTPFGYEQLIADPKVMTIERSLPNDRLTDGRQVGLSASGLLVQNRLTYTVSVFNGTGVNSSTNDNSQFMWAGRLSASLFQREIDGHRVTLNVGLNGLITRDGSVAKPGYGFDSTPGGATDQLFTGRRSATGVDAQFRAGGLGLDAEYLRAEFHPTNRIPFSQVTADGWSILASWFLVPRTLQAIGRYETFDPNAQLPANASDLWTVGLTWFLKGDDLKLSCNYLVGEPAGILKRQHRLLTRVQVVF